MKMHLSPILALLLVAVVVSHAALPPEVYWDKMLPSTEMPKAVRERLTTDFEDDKGTVVNVGKGSVVVTTGKPGRKGTSIQVGKGGVGVDAGKPSAKGTSVNVGKGGVGVNTVKARGKGTSVNVGKGGVGVGVNTGKPGGKGTSVHVGEASGVHVSTGKGKAGGGTRVSVGKGSDPFAYIYAASEDQLHDDPNVALFFQEKDLHLGKKMNLHFTKTTNEATFLPRKVADAIPFSSSKMPKILDQLSVEPESAEAEAMKQTVEECEKPAQEGEDKYCATSLESMVDFSTSKMGTNVKAISTEVDKNDTPKQQYSIVGLRKMVGDKSVVCHDQTYAYAVFYCHATQSTRAYKLSLVGADGTKVKAVAVCHTDTAKWNPKHLAFLVLKSSQELFPSATSFPSITLCGFLKIRNH